jgi:S1-C subfamily serine protease
VPGTWSDGEHAGDDDDEVRPSQPVHPDDRLWRHPSELAWGIAPPTPPTGSPRVDVGPPPAPAGKPWGLLVTSSLLGAAVAIGTVALMGGLGTADPDRIVDRVGVRERVADAFAAFRDDSPAGLPDVVELVAPSVVRIEVPAGAVATGGSGVVVRDDGHIVTNAHVVGDADELTIIRSDGRAVAGRVVGVDAVTDLAVVAPAEESDVEWTPAVRGPASDLRIGDPTVALAAADASGTPTITVGMVAALSQWLDVGGHSTLHDLVETDVPVPTTATGGALCDRSGRVVGLTTGAGGDDGAGYATAMETAWPTAEALIEEGVVHHAWLGVDGGNLGPAETAGLGLGQASAVVITAVSPSSPAEAGGLVPGDIVLAVDGAGLDSMNELVVAIRAHAPGDTARLTVLRDGQPVEITVTLAEKP